MTPTKENEKEELVKELERFCPHDYCDDSWYSCAKHPEGCANDSLPKDVCTCGVEKQREKIADFIIQREHRILSRLLETLERASKEHGKIKAVVSQHAFKFVDIGNDIDEAISIIKERL